MKGRVHVSAAVHGDACGPPYARAKRPPDHDGEAEPRSRESSRAAGRTAERTTDRTAEIRAQPRVCPRPGSTMPCTASGPPPEPSNLCKTRVQAAWQHAAAPRAHPPTTAPFTTCTQAPSPPAHAAACMARLHARILHRGRPARSSLTRKHVPPQTAPSEPPAQRFSPPVSPPNEGL